MGKRRQIYVGAAIVALGVLLLIGALWDIDVWGYLWPLLIIGAGVLLLTRVQARERYGETTLQLLGDVRRAGAWTVRPQDIWCLVGDVRLDLSEAKIPPGETTLRLQGFANGITVILPEGVGLTVTSTAFVTEARMLGDKQDYVLTPYTAETDAYREADRKIRLELLYVVADLKVRRPRA